MVTTISNNKILIIETSDGTQIVISQCLKKEGHKIYSATNEIDGLKLYNKIEPILVILDISSLVSSKFAFLDKLKSHTASCSVIVLTEKESSKEIENCFKHGVTNFIRKPFNEYELKGVVHNSITLRQMERNLLRETMLRKDLEALLCELESKIITFLAILPKTVFKIKEDGTILFHDSGKSNLFVLSGLHNNIIVGKKVNEVFPLNVTQQIMSNTEKVIKTGQTRIFTYTTHQNETVRKHIVRTAISGTDEVLIYIFDFIDSNRSKNLIIHRTSEWGATFDAVSDLIIITDKDGRIMLCNKSATKHFHTRYKNLSGRMINNVFQYDFKSGSRTSKPKKDDVKFTISHKWYNVASYPLQIGSEVDGIVYVIKDINDRKHTEDELLHASSQNDLILKSMSSLLICVNSDNKVTLWNTTAEKIFSIAAKDIIGRQFFECNINWDWPKITQSITDCLKDEKSLRLKDFKYTSSSMKKGFLNITVSPFIGQEADQSDFLLSGEEITEYKILENEFNQAQKLKSVGQLAAGVAHEINTPIQYIGDNVRFIDESVTDLFNLIAEYNKFLEEAKQGKISSELITCLEKLKEDIDLQFILDDVPSATKQSLEGINRVAEIVQAMKEFSHPIEVEKTFIDINKSINSIIKVSRNEWKYVAEIKTDLSADLPLVQCLPGEMNQVYLNLIINAAHAIADTAGDRPEDKGCITISTCKIGKEVEVRINDTGTGIPEDARSNIFDPFFTTKEIGKGTGQGLSLAYAIVVEKHKGHISFETEIGTGTTFIILLPVDKD